MDYTPFQYKSVVQILGLVGSRRWERSTWAFFHCPLGSHRDKTPSFKVDFETGGWFCFGCKEHGHLNGLCKILRHETMFEILGLKADMENLSEIPTPYKVWEPEPRGEIPLVESPRGVMVPWNVSPTARDYLDYRGILPRVAVHANIKYMEDGYSGEFPLRKRLMIPIYDDRGRVINWECRDTTFQDRLKCFYPKNSTKPLYEWYKLDPTQPLFLLEGCIKTLVARSDPYFKNSTTTFGSGINELQLEQLQLFEEVIVVLDRDKAGFKGAEILQEQWKGKRLQYLNINSDAIKDVDEIPTKLNMTVSDFRAQGGFVYGGTLPLNAVH